MKINEMETLRRRMREVQHPSYETLLQYAEKSLHEDQAVGLREHLSSCSLCLNEFLFISEELFAEIEKPLTAAELLKNKLLKIVAVFEKVYRAGTPRPLFRLTAVCEPGMITPSSLDSDEIGRTVRMDLHKDPRFPYVTILKEGEDNEITVLRSKDYWVNVEVNKVNPVQQLSGFTGAVRLFAIYTAARVPFESDEGATQFIDSLQTGKIEHRIASAFPHLDQDGRSG